MLTSVLSVLIWRSYYKCEMASVATRTKSPIVWVTILVAEADRPTQYQSRAKSLVDNFLKVQQQPKLPLEPDVRWKDCFSVAAQEPVEIGR